MPGPLINCPHTFSLMIFDGDTQQRNNESCSQTNQNFLWGQSCLMCFLHHHYIMRMYTYKYSNPKQLREEMYHYFKRIPVFYLFEGLFMCKETNKCVCTKYIYIYLKTYLYTLIINPKISQTIFEVTSKNLMCSLM
jgi:hypothetical protein